MGRAPCCEKMGLKKGPWTPEEDQILISFIFNHGHSNWRALPKQAGLLRCGKSCRLRWMNYLKPDIKRGNFTIEEEDTIINLHSLLGNRWSAIAARLPGRTDNEIKNVWHTHLKKRLQDYEPATPKMSNKKKTTKPKSEKNESKVTNSSNPSAYYNSTSPSMSEVSSVTLKSNEGNSNETNYMVMKSGNNVTSSDQDSCSFENFGVDIDESFWKEALYSQDHEQNLQTLNLEDGIDDIQAEIQYLLTSVDSEMGHQSFGQNLDNDIDMEFWFDVFARTGGEQEHVLGDLMK